MQNMKIITWNVNGIRSRIFNDNISSKLKKNTSIVPEESSAIQKLLSEFNPDILCIQETRCGLEKSKTICIPGYNSFFNESKLEGARSADRYSGTAVFYKQDMIVKNISIDLPGYEDKEGRIIKIKFEDFILITVYAPNSGTNFDNKICIRPKNLNNSNNKDFWPNKWIRI